MKKVIFLCIFLFVLIMSVSAQFFSVNLDDSKDVVISKLEKVGLQLYKADSGDKDMLYFATNDTITSRTIVSNLPIVDGLIIEHVEAVFSADKLVSLQLESPSYKDNVARQFLKWKVFEVDLINRSNSKYKDFEYIGDRFEDNSFYASAFFNKKTSTYLQIGWMVFKYKDYDEDFFFSIIWGY